MFYSGWIQISFLIAVLILLVPIIGTYIAKVFQGETTFLHPLLQPCEKWIYRLTGVKNEEEMTWKCYLRFLLLFNFLGIIFVFLIQKFQGILPCNPEQFSAVSTIQALNTAISFATNTDFQTYAPEISLSYGTQMLGLTTQNFLSAATGQAVLLALIRGVVRKSSQTIGNFWVDLVRTILYILLPLSLIFAVILITQGVPQTLSPYSHISTLEQAQQTLPLGPVASQVAIKQLGTNGGGFFNTNSAHPFENPTAFSNFLELLCLILLPAALTYSYGRMVRSHRHGWILLITMGCLWLAGVSLALYAESQVNPLFPATTLMEGKEVRIGVAQSVLWAVSTTASANGSVNVMLDSLSPLAGGVALFNLMLGELVFGGLGVGLCSMLMFVLLTVFLAGLMVGRTPEYFGKKIEKSEMQWVCVAILVPSLLILLGSGYSSIRISHDANMHNMGPHALTSMLFTFASTAGNNGSCFAGLQTSSVYYQLVLAAVMLLSRLSIVVPSLAIAGLLAGKKASIESEGVFSTKTMLFLILLLSVILIVGALTFLPALCLGPIVEYMLMMKGVSF
ncbi:MAG: potassium-transporting ATPase subunit KdpA [Verrucomicrobia bacterium]|nr:potassium-transporting ATPase subunit KdpA [Verrucomicrobiota bacterium]MBS0645239.1 potassium-transporting ATPase subunit KdpA [Verrucomicrobiota bacterium]